MNKNAIKKFAIEARKKLIASVSDKAGMLGITPEGCSEPVSKGTDFEVYKTIAGTEITLGKSQCEQRRKLKEQIETRGFEAVVEEVAYTWFNRICAIRFMEVNDYLPTRVRVISSEKEGKNEPDIVTQAPDVDLDFTDKEREYILDCKMNNKLDDLFKMLFIKQCNKLSEILPELFEATEDYTEMLLNISYTNKDDIIYMLVNQETGIPEADFNVSTIGEDGQPTGQVEIIGWLYQYYNTELKDDTFAQLKKNVKISKERIPAATQLFTPDWIVRYMVENSVGRLWIEHLRSVDPTVNEKEVAERFGWKYYLPEAEQEADVDVKLAEIRTTYKDLKPEDITCIDPCMGSGHILVAMFDVLMDIYKSAGYSERDAAFEIVEHNIHGLDIDKRAYQLAYFAVMMKGRGYNRRFLLGKLGNDEERNYTVPKVYAIEESNGVNRQQLKYFGASLNSVEKNNALNQINGLLDDLSDATEYGSILSVDNYDWEILERFVKEESSEGQLNFDTLGIDETKKKLARLVEIGKVISQKYDVIVTNPPYMGNSGMNQRLVEYLKTNYFADKNDLYACVMTRSMKMLKKTGIYSMVTMESWMFLSGFEDLRERILNEFSLLNLIHMPYLGKGKTSMGISFGTVAFVARRGYVENIAGLGQCLRYYEMDEDDKPLEYPIKNERLNKYLQPDFLKVPGKTIAYWASKDLLDAFKYIKLEDVGFAYQGIITGKVDYFLKMWHEIDFNKVIIGETSPQVLEYTDGYFPYVKGGEYRKWYGNHNYLLKWENNGSGLTRSRTENRSYFLREGITWTLLTSGKMSFRYLEQGFLCDVAGSSYFIESEAETINYTLAFLNSVVCEKILDMLNPTMNLNIKDVLALPLKHENKESDEWIINLVDENIQMEKDDWDSSEISWNFKKHPLVQEGENTLECCDKKRKEQVENYVIKLTQNEKLLDEYFIRLYSVKMCEPDVRIAINSYDTESNIRSLISYAVGCMFGRYSLDVEGIVYAGGEWDSSKYSSFIPDVDNVIPITDEEYLSEDMVSRFCQWIKIVYGEEKLEENLDYIARALGNKGNTSRDVLRNYFLNDFITDHMRIYQKRPIYWLFDSGKVNGFKALVYMHRCNADTVAKVRIDYLHNIQKSIEQAKLSAEYLRDNGSGAEKAKATKLITKYTKQLAEIHLYDEAMAHIANQRIEIDLDDGVKVNYEKFQGVEVAQEGKKALKIDLLAKIK